MKKFGLAVVLVLAGCTSGCITPPSVITDKAPCSVLIPDQIADAVPNAQLGPVPDGGDADRNTEEFTRFLEEMVDRWRLFGVGQTAAKRQEFEEKTVIIEGQVRCEERDREAIEAARPKMLGLF